MVARSDSTVQKTAINIGSKPLHRDTATLILPTIHAISALFTADHRWSCSLLGSSSSVGAPQHIAATTIVMKAQHGHLLLLGLEIAVVIAAVV